MSKCKLFNCCKSPIYTGKCASCGEDKLNFEDKLSDEEHKEIYEIVKQRRANDDGKRVTLDTILKK